MSTSRNRSQAGVTGFLVQSGEAGDKEKKINFTAGSRNRICIIQQNVYYEWYQRDIREWQMGVDQEKVLWFSYIRFNGHDIFWILEDMIVDEVIKVIYWT